MKKTHAAALAGLIVVIAGVAVSLPRRPVDPPSQADMTIDAATRSEVIDAVISNLKQAYVFPDKALVIENALRERQHEFDKIVSADAFADALTETLRQSADGDQHLDVRYVEHTLPPESSDDAPSAEDLLMERNRNIRKNAGFERVQRLKGNIGLIEFSGFYRPIPFKPKLVAAMNLLADTSALIIDLRNCGGGDPESVMLAASYFFDKKTHLNDIYWRDENRTEERWTDPNVEGARYGEQRPIVILTSEETGSACEDFSYAMKNAKRAITLGGRTAGAAHSGTRKRLSDHFRFFLPSGRPINPVTHADWEMVGVQPDLKVAPKKAIEIAHRELLKKLIASEADLDWKKALEDTLRDAD